MEEFNTIEKVKDLFEKVNCVGNENCYFIAYKDLQKNGGMVKGMEYPYDALLINQTENGIGMFYLRQDGIPWNYDIAKMKVQANSYFFVKNDEIKNITVKNFALFKTKVKKISIKLNDGKNHQVYANINEALIPYQEENFTKFMNKYSK